MFYPDKATYEEIEESRQRPVGTYFSSETNSMPFSNCCRAACSDGIKCPRCGRYVKADAKEAK